jgi:hypothetical protein
MLSRQHHAYARVVEVPWFAAMTAAVTGTVN